MKFRWLFIIIILFCTTESKSQSSYKPGYIQLASGDTLYGEIDYRTDIQMGTECRFKSGDMDAVREYKPDELTAYRVDNSRYFVSKDINATGGNKRVFLEYLIKGKVDIFYYRDINDIDHYYIDKQGYGLMELPFKITYRKINGANYQFDSKDHIGILKYYLQDAPDFQTQIEQIRKPDRENLIKLTEEYQKKVCKDENCIVYERKIPFLRIALNPVTGVSLLRGSNKKIIEVGGLVYFWMPRSNENLYFKTGLIYKSKTNYEISTSETIENDYYSTYEIPLQIQYQFSSKRVKPLAGIGINYLILKHQLSDPNPHPYKKYTDVGHTICLTAGFNYKITKSLALSASLNSDFTPLLFLIDDGQTRFRLLSTSLRIGLYIYI